MLTKGDDYPIHQLPLPVSEVGSERNFYDRYFFNGYCKEGETFFAAVLCVYPNLNIMDGSFVLVRKGVQHNFRYSRVMGLERLDTKVGALQVEVLEPLQKLKVKVDDKKTDLFVELIFEGRFEGELLGGLLVAGYGDTCIALAGSNPNEKGRHLHSGNLIWWRAILKMKELGYRWFDIGGADSSLTPKSILLFKAGLRGTPYQLIGEFGCSRGKLLDHVLKWYIKCFHK